MRAPMLSMKGLHAETCKTVEDMWSDSSFTQVALRLGMAQVVATTQWSGKCRASVEQW